MPEYYMILARKKYQNTRIFLMSALRVNKMPEFYIIIARKIFSRFFFFLGGGGTCSPLPVPVSYACVYTGLRTLSSRKCDGPNAVATNYQNEFCSLTIQSTQTSNLQDHNSYSYRIEQKCNKQRLQQIRPTVHNL